MICRSRKLLACESPRRLLEWLYVLDLHNQDIARLCGFDLKWATQIVDLGQVNVFDIICTVIVANLASKQILESVLPHVRKGKNDYISRNS